MTVSTILGGPKPQFFDGNGVPLGGGTVEFFVAGTSTPLDSFTDSSGLTANTNPVLLNSRGEPPNGLYAIDSVGYKIVLKDQIGAVLWTVDNAFSVATGAGGSASGFLSKTVSTSIDYTVLPSDLNALIRVTGNRVFITLPDTAVVGDGFVITIISDGNNPVNIAPVGAGVINGDPDQELQPGSHLILTSSGASWNGPQTYVPLSIATATGGVNSMAAVYNPFIPTSAISHGLAFLLKPVGQITSTAPTLALNGQGSLPIVNTLGGALLLTDIQSSNQSLLLQYDAGLNAYVLLNTPHPPPPPTIEITLLDTPTLLNVGLLTLDSWTTISDPLLDSSNATVAIISIVCESSIVNSTGGPVDMAHTANLYMRANGVTDLRGRGNQKAALTVDSNNVSAADRAPLLLQNEIHVKLGAVGEFDYYMELTSTYKFLDWDVSELWLVGYHS